MVVKREYKIRKSGSGRRMKRRQERCGEQGKQEAGESWEKRRFLRERDAARTPQAYKWCHANTCATASSGQPGYPES
jgi:hypothetical protein